MTKPYTLKEQHFKRATGGIFHSPIIAFVLETLPSYLKHCLTMEHPYTKLLTVLDAARYVRYFPDPGLIYCWHGQGRVEVLNKEGACVDFFAADSNSSVEQLDGAIEKHHAEELN